MNKYRNTPKDIHSRIYLFILGCFRDIVRKIPRTVENIPIISQLSYSLISNPLDHFVIPHLMRNLF